MTRRKPTRPPGRTTTGRSRPLAAPPPARKRWRVYLTAADRAALAGLARTKYEGAASQADAARAAVAVLAGRKWNRRDAGGAAGVRGLLSRSHRDPNDRLKIKAWSLFVGGSDQKNLDRICHEYGFRFRGEALRLAVRCAALRNARARAKSVTTR